MTPFWPPLSSSFYYELCSWELEQKQDQLQKLEENLTQEKLNYEELQQRFAFQLDAIIKKHQTIDENLPLILKYTNALQEQFKDFQTRALTLQNTITNNKNVEKYLKQKFIAMRKLENRTNIRLKNFTVFKYYLEAVSDASNGLFPTISDLLEGFAFLGKIREDAFHQIQHANSTREEQQNLLAKQCEEGEIEYTKLQNRAQELKKTKETLSLELIDLESKLANLKIEKSSEILSLGRIQMSIYNLYLRVCSKLNYKPKLENKDTIGQLIFLQNAMKDLKSLKERIQLMSAIPESSVAPFV